VITAEEHFDEDAFTWEGEHPEENAKVLAIMAFSG